MNNEKDIIGQEDEAIIKAKLEHYRKDNMEVHIVKKGGKWLNAYILSETSPGIYKIRERKFGVMTLFLIEIFSVEEVVGETFDGGESGRSFYQP